MATKRTNNSSGGVNAHDEEQLISGEPEAPAKSTLDPATTLDGEGIILTKSLTWNTYSLIYVADPKSWAFLYGIVFFLIQTCLLSFAMIGAFDTGSNNFFQAPVDVSVWVRISGYIILLLSIPLFGDLLDTVERVHEGYHPMVTRQAPNATCLKWAFANFLQFTFGIIFQFLTFVFIAKSTSVRDMLLNFAGLEFVTKIDDLGFSLADRGYFSDSLKLACKDVKDHKSPTTQGPWFRRLAMIFLVALLLAGYSAVFYYQRSGAFLCTRMEVQFGDAFWAELPFFSGVYFVDKATRKDERLVFGDERTNGETSMFRYCANTKSFVFLPRPNETANECNSELWYAKSPNSESYNILESNPQQWKTQRPSDNAIFYPLDYFNMHCLDCSADTCNIPSGGTCSMDQFGNNVCNCNEGFFGEQCQFEFDQICDTIEFDHRFDPFPIQKYEFPSWLDVVTDENDKYLLYRNKALYYYMYPSDSELSGYMNIIVFFGRRYYFLLVDWNELFAEKETNDTAPAAFVAYMEKEEGRFLDDIEQVTALFVSEPMDLGTPQEKPIPTELAWYLVTTDYYGVRLGIGASISTRLLCTTCNAVSGPFCEVAGTCNEDTKTCDCDEGFVGPRCEKYDSSTSDIE